MTSRHTGTSLTYKTLDRYENKEHVPNYWRTSLKCLENLNTTAITIGDIQNSVADLVHHPSYPKYSDLILDRIRQLRVICDQLNEGDIRSMVVRSEPGRLLEELNAVIELKSAQLAKSKSEAMNMANIPICENYVFGRCTLGATCLRSHTTQSLTTYMEGWIERKLELIDVDEPRKTLNAKKGFGGEAWMVVLQLLPTTIFNRIVVRSVDKPTVRILCKSFAQNTCPNITEVDLSKNSLCTLYATGVTKLSKALETNTSLTHLSLSDNALGNVGAIAILTALKPGLNETLTSLNLANNALNFLDASTGPVLFQALQGANKLQKIGLACSNLGTKGCESLATALSSHELIYLDLYHCNIGDAGLTALFEILRTSQSLVALELGWNNITMEVMAPLCSIIETNRTLEALLLSHNLNIHRKGALALAETLKKNTTLAFLDIRWTNPGDEGLQSIMDALVLNRSIRDIKFQHNELDPKVESMAQEKMRKRPAVKGKLESLDSLVW